VGPDDRVPLGNAPTAERRLVRLEWLRTLLAKAQIKDAAPNRIQGKPASDANNPGSARPPKPTTSQLLQAAETRLAEELVEADRAASGALPAAADYTSERAAMTHVLAERDFRNLQAPTARDTAMEKLSAWLNRLLASLDKLQLHAAWVGRLIVWGFILAVCVGLALGLMQLERRWRIRLAIGSCGLPMHAAPQPPDFGARPFILLTGHPSRASNPSAFGRQTGRARRASIWLWCPRMTRANRNWPRLPPTLSASGTEAAPPPRATTGRLKRWPMR
jgi:hypothetical protein